MFGHRSCGGRICFKTNAEKFTIITKIEAVRFDIGMSVFSGSSLDVYAGERKNARFLELLNPPAQSDAEVTVEREFDKHSDEMEDITVFLPRNETITYF